MYLIQTKKIFLNLFLNILMYNLKKESPSLLLLYAIEVRGFL